MIAASITGYGIAAALDEIKRRQFDEAEERLREKMKPARLAVAKYIGAAEEDSGSRMANGGSQLSTGNSQPLR